MEVHHERCAGLDVHKDTVVVCIRIGAGRKVRREVRTFGTVTRDLLELADWLASEQITHVAMEATGVYWKPVWHILEGHFTLVLADAAHIKNVPGRKTDVKDAEWIADLLAHGLIRSSFIAEPAMQRLRDLTRTRKQLVGERTRHVQRIHKALEDANVKIASVITDLLGRSGRAFLDAMLAGESDPEKLADLTDRRVKASRAEIVEALRGFVNSHHRFMIRLHLTLIQGLDAALADIEHEVAALLTPFRAAHDILISLPGLSDTAAQGVLAEIGPDMSRFPADANLISWAGLCPRCDESAGKRRSTRIRHGAFWLKTLLVQCAWAAVRKKDSRFKTMFHRIKARRGAKRAIVAVAAEMLRCIWHMLSTGSLYTELSSQPASPHSRQREARRLVTRLQALGFTVDLPITSA